MQASTGKVLHEAACGGMKERKDVSEDGSSRPFLRRAAVSRSEPAPEAKPLDITELSPSLRAEERLWNYFPGRRDVYNSNCQGSKM